jgi:hypothetical protein
MECVGQGEKGWSVYHSFARIGILAPDQMTALVAELKQISKMVTGLARSLNTENHPAQGC